MKASVSELNSVLGDLLARVNAMALYFWSVVAFCMLLQNVATDNGVDGISGLCLDCLRRVQPAPEKLCIDSPTTPGSKQCGPFKMSEAFYIDCKSFFPKPVPDHWDTWQKCYLDSNCSRECVKAYHNHYGPNCQLAKGDQSTQVVCADYGQIHFGGPSSCGSESYAATEFINNMTLKCGCETVHGNRSVCLQSMQTPNYDDFVSKESFTGALVGVCCAAVVVIAVVIVVAVYWNYRKSKANIHQAEKGGVVSRKLHPFTDQRKTDPPTSTTNSSKEAQAGQMADYRTDGSASGHNSVRAPIPVPR